jgi:hypothetical protein
MIETFYMGPVPGGHEYMHYDHATDSITLEQVFDCEPVTELNRARQNVDSGWKGDMHCVASIPMPLYMEMRKQGIFDDEKRLSKWLNDPENRFFRTKLGRV